MVNKVEVRPFEVEFLETLKQGKNLVVFKVCCREGLCVMKVATAYSRLKSMGLCMRGVIPNFYGTIRNIQPADWASFGMFLPDKLPPSAILIEYIPNLQSIDLPTFSKEHLARHRQILDYFHEANVLHGDPMPRNLTVSSAAGQESDGERSPRQEKWVKKKVEMVDYFVDALVHDYREEKLNRTISFYYEWI
ncbi:hypothetical protein BDV12DRAFT_189347 [Aspergillus spectabilis]